MTDVSESYVISAIDQEARGVTRREGKVVFVSGAIPGDRVTLKIIQSKASFDRAQVKEWIEVSPNRVSPICVHFGVCGGCSLQHVDPLAQVAYKQRFLEDNMLKIGRVIPEQVWAPIQGPHWHYRQRARLSVHWDEKKQSAFVGFHERSSNIVANMHSCLILSEPISHWIDPLRFLVGSLSIKTRVPQIELAQGSDGVPVLVFRILEELSPKDEVLLRQFSDEYGARIWLQPKGLDSQYPFYPIADGMLQYTLPEYDLTLVFAPSEFTQVNSVVNRALVRRAVNLLQLQPQDVVLDLFCGIGNFTLPIARSGAQVMGIDGSRALIERAIANAQLNHLIANTEWLVADLFGVTEEQISRWPKANKVLIDPPRDGAREVVKAMQWLRPERIVYVSCNPSTLARDAQELVQQGYRLQGVGIANMFPHTTHVESIALFVLKGVG
jgi:23S rRNA (uracil1939-C5)-methyltransferase